MSKSKPVRRFNNLYSYKYLIFVVFSIIVILILNSLTGVSKKANINQVELSGNSQPVTLEGVIIKDVPSQLPGTYYFMTLAGQIVQLTNKEINVTEGTYVAVTGYLVGYNNQGYQQLNVSNIAIK